MKVPPIHTLKEKYHAMLTMQLFKYNYQTFRNLKEQKSEANNLRLELIFKQTVHENVIFSYTVRFKFVLQSYSKIADWIKQREQIESIMKLDHFVGGRSVTQSVSIPAVSGNNKSLNQNWFNSDWREERRKGAFMYL